MKRFASRSRTDVRPRAGFALVTALVLAPALTGCTHVRYSRNGPNGETWTVYSHTFGDDTVSYCAPQQFGGNCFAAREYSRAPSVLPSQAYAAPPPMWGPPQQPPPAWGPPPVFVPAPGRR